jgi:hypothetical protein
MHPQDMLVMPIDEVLNANVILKPPAELEISLAKVAERCSQCHNIMAAGLVLWEFSLCLCYECSVFLIRRRASERQDEMWQHLLSFRKEKVAKRMDQSEPRATEETALAQEELSRREAHLMSVWKGQESLLRDLLMLHGDGFELQSTKGQRPLSRTLDTRELIRKVIIQQKWFTVRLLHVNTWIPEMQNRIKISELTLLCMINNDIQEIN